MGNKGGGRKGFVKAAAATKQPDAPAEAKDPVEEVGQVYAQSDQKPEKKDTGQPGTAISLPDVEPADNETRGQMLQRHKKETRQLKDAAKKAGKKHKDEADKQEAALAQRQEEELAQRSMAEFGLADATAAEPVDHADTEAAAKAPSRAQKRRSKAAAQASQREQQIAEENEAMGESAREAEQRQLSALLAPLGLCISDIPADGHCLYRAIDDQLRQCSRASGQEGPASDSAHSPGREAAEGAVDHAGPAEGAMGQERLRASAAGYMRSHAADFEPFLDQDGEGPGDSFAQYCNDVESTAAWGGDMELNALAAALHRHIQVHSVGMPPVSFGTSFQGKQASLRVCFLRHAFGLGEHYNSVKPLSAESAGGEDGFQTVGADTKEQAAPIGDDDALS